ncbi:MAG: YcxB family protein [Thalassotalea sp.]
MIPEYKTQFTLTKDYYRECFEESVPVVPFKQAYFKAFILLVLGGIFVLMGEINPYAAWFVFSLGVLEAVAQYYRKPWWVTRQMFSRAAKGDVNLTINESGIATHSFYNEQYIAWADINAFEETDCGWVIIHSQGRSYLSKQHLNDDVNTLLVEKAQHLVGE